MRTIKLILEYDGTNYVGWQLQPNGLSIQQVVEEALERLLGEQVRVYSSGRTDAGVHAKGMVAVFRTQRNLPLRAFTYGLNNLLPCDIKVQGSAEVDADFNPRADAKGKHYRYTIVNAPHRSPLSRLYAWQLKAPLDLDLMREAAVHFVGERDFCAFRASGCSARTTVRTIYSVEVVRSGEFIHIDVFGSGFLRNMVRIMAGTLAEIGQGKMPPDVVAALLTGQARVNAGMTAPPQGLCLMEVFYGSEFFLDNI
ncbi:tRNA pseudouridine(38-40) synthase TruA [Geobacter sp. DSM 9736]|uniref:tRNA pseudouridine(38-40) synthase TruA n=1 Tax=Geobacter sp. DSM 9736 TaxID=1277350 RepID=UPI000B504A39|nr:tRNA pseudouridine(38-40) synthase TruA [Geobacter sp. DSM 9736]